MYKIKLHTSINLVIIGVLFIISPAKSITINFDDAGLSHKSVITNFYNDVQFNGISNPFPIGPGAFPAPLTVPVTIGGAAIWDPTGKTAPGESAPNFAVGQGQGDLGDAGILMTFANPVSTLTLTGLDFGNSDTEGMTLTAYDSSGNFIAQEHFSSQFANGAIRGKIAFSGMKYVAFNYTNTKYGFYGIDDLEFKVDPIIVIDPGHGLLLGDDGMKHYQRPESPTFGLREDNLTLSIAKAAKEQLENDGYRVGLTRYGVDAAYPGTCGTPDLNTNIINYCNNDLKARIKFAKKFKEKDNEDVLFVSIHTNGGNARSVRGRTQTFYCFNPSGLLSELLLDEITNIATPIFSLFTGGYKNCDFAVIKKTSEIEISGSLIEVLYHNNLDDEALLNSPWFLDLAGERIAKAIKDFINEQQAN